jgi:hypothetical protein
MRSAKGFNFCGGVMVRLDGGEAEREGNCGESVSSQREELRDR